MVYAESAKEHVRSVMEVLMSSAEEQQLPEAPCTGPGGGQTAMDQLIGDLKKSRPTDCFFAGCYPNLTIFSVRPYYIICYYLFTTYIRKENAYKIFGIYSIYIKCVVKI